MPTCVYVCRSVHCASRGTGYVSFRRVAAAVSPASQPHAVCRSTSKQVNWMPALQVTVELEDLQIMNFCPPASSNGPTSSFASPP